LKIKSGFLPKAAKEYEKSKSQKSPGFDLLDVHPDCYIVCNHFSSRANNSSNSQLEIFY